MGKLDFTPKQQLILNEIKNSNFIKQNFYFTGGTALAALYLHHRLSEDLDFFSQELEVVRIFFLEFPDREKLKVDFGYYPYKRLEKGERIDGIEVDSMFDIAVNKLQTIHQRSDSKDFVDLYFLLKEYTIWDLIEGVRVKFRMSLDPYTVAADCLKIGNFKDLPRMLVSLEIQDLQDFYKKLAKKLGKTITTD